LTLRAGLDPDDADEPWIWEVVRVDRHGDQEDIVVGGAVSREAAMAAAELAARAPEGSA
jgi:hypothetical protein